jgi:predicted secreted hydrolase
VNGRRRIIGLTAGGTLAAATGAGYLFLGGAAPESVTVQRSALSEAVIEKIAALSEEDAFERPSGPWELALPADHGGHPNARAETWILAAHLEDESGRTIGVNYSLARFGLQSDAPDVEASPWDLRALYRAHVTLTREGEAIGEERFSRGGGVAGHDPDAREVWLDHWLMTYGEGADQTEFTLTASVRDVPIRLTLSPVKAPVQANQDGAAPVRGFSMTRLRVDGEIGHGEATSRVSGHAWLDRFWGELPLPGGPLAYDRLVIQVDDGTDLSLVRSRRRDGQGAAKVEGMLIHPIGTVEPLSDDVIEMAPTEYWSPHTGDARYPIEWRVTGRGIDLRITPLVEDQTFRFALPAWNGLVRVEGRNGAMRVQGQGTLQLTGYEEP